MLNKITLNLPHTINIVIWSKKNENSKFIFIYNKNKKLKLHLNYGDKDFFYDKNTNSITFERNLICKNSNKISKSITSFIKSWDFYFFSKVKFKGKGFRIRFLKKNKLVKFFFGRSHKTFIFFKKILLKKINKYKFILKAINKNKISLDSSIATQIKPINFYTLRGIRKSRQIIYKRKGKKGTYI